MATLRLICTFYFQQKPTLRRDNNFLGLPDEKTEQLRRLKEKEEQRKEQKKEKQRQRQRRYRQNLKLRQAQQKQLEEQERERKEKESQESSMTQLKKNIPHHVQPKNLQQQQEQPQQQQLQTQTQPKVQNTAQRRAPNITTSPQRQMPPLALPITQIEEVEVESDKLLLPSLRQLLSELTIADSPATMRSQNSVAFRTKLSAGSQTRSRSNTSPRLPSNSLRAGTSSPRLRDSPLSARGSPHYSPRTSSGSASPRSPYHSDPNSPRAGHLLFMPPAVLRGESIEPFPIPTLNIGPRLTAPASSPILNTLHEDRSPSRSPSRLSPQHRSPSHYDRRSDVNATYSSPSLRHTQNINPTSLYSPMAATTNFPLPHVETYSPRYSPVSSSSLTPMSSSTDTELTPTDSFS